MGGATCNNKRLSSPAACPGLKRRLARGAALLAAQAMCLSMARLSQPSPAAALMGAIVVGPRLGRFLPDGKTVEFEPASPSMAVSMPMGSAVRIKRVWGGREQADERLTSRSRAGRLLLGGGHQTGYACRRGQCWGQPFLSGERGHLVCALPSSLLQALGVFILWMGW